MCGIIGYLGSKRTAKSLVEVLQKLEYRGYDSAGLSINDGGKINVIKSVGNIDNLKAIVADQIVATSLIAHTRWATHGAVTKLNAHPHLSKNQTWSVVHNGIIENYKTLKSKLASPPESQTDTSVLAQLLEEQNVQGIDEFIDVFDAIFGSYAVVAQNKNDQNSLYVAKYKSPLYIAKNQDGDILVASDPICFVGFSKKYYVMKDGEFAKVGLGKIQFIDKNKNTIQKPLSLLDEVFEEAGKMHYEHFMLKEIEEESLVIKRQVEVYQQNGVLNKFDIDFVEKFSKVVLVGCGTAYHAGLMGAKFIAKLAGVFAVAEIASEFLYDSPLFVDEQTLCIFVSQSGETADTCGAMALAKRHGATCVALTNVTYSSLALNADYVLPVCAGPEIAVASTKAYVCQLTALYMFASHLGKLLNKNSVDHFKQINDLANRVSNFDKAQIERIANKLVGAKDAIFIGKNLDYITATESALKLKEITYINSASYPSGELKHGFLALVENGTPLFAVAGEDLTKPKTLNSASEARSRGAVLVAVANEKLDGADETILVDETDEFLFAIRSVVPMQYLAYRVSVLKNINPDKPRNLAKSVTVE